MSLIGDGIQTHCIGIFRLESHISLEEAVRVTKALNGNKHTDKKNIEIDVHCLNRRGETFEPNRRWDPDTLYRNF